MAIQYLNGIFENSGEKPGESHLSVTHCDNLLPSVRMVDVPTIESELRGADGAISVVTCGEGCPFEIKRIYWIHGAQAGEIRGRHAHRTLQQMVVAVAGSFEISISNGHSVERFLLDSPRRALTIGAGFWRTILTRKANSVLLVAASAPYDEADYIRKYSEFRAFRKSLEQAVIPMKHAERPL